MVGHVDCLNGLRGGHAHGHRDQGDGRLQQGDVPHYDQGVQHSLTSPFAKNISLRGGVTKKNEKIWENVPIGGGRVKKNPEMSQFQFGNFENRGGSLFFKNVTISIII